MPEEIESNLNNWMQLLSKVLTMDIDGHESVKMLVFKCKGESLRSVILYFTKYREDIEPLVQTFSQQVYEACMKISESDSSNKVNKNPQIEYQI